MTLKVNFTGDLTPSAKIDDKQEEQKKIISTKTEDYPADSVELSTQKPKSKKSLYIKIGATIAGIATLIGGVMYFRRGKGAKDVIKEGEKLTDDLANELKNPTHNEPHVEAPKPNEAPKAEIPKEEPKVETPKSEEPPVEVPKPKEAPKAEEPKGPTLEQLAHEAEIKSINSYLDLGVGVKDDEIAELILSRYGSAREYIAVVSKTPTEEENIVYNLVSDMVKKAKNPLEKEKWMGKQVKLANSNVNNFNRKTKMEQLFELRNSFGELYKTKGVKFKNKDSFAVDVINEQLDAIYQQTKEAQKLKEHFGSDTDYDLYRKLAEKSKEYLNYARKKNDPMKNYLSWEKVDNHSSVTPFLRDTMPDIIKSEKDLLKQEDLYVKFLNVQKLDNQGKELTNDTFDILRDMYTNLYKSGQKLPNGAKFKHEKQIKDQLSNLMDEFIFKKFDIPGIVTFDEKLELSKRVINRFNKTGWWMEPKDVKYEQITDALMKMGEESGAQSYYMSAVNLAKNVEAKDHAVKLIDRILKKENLSPKYKTQLENMKKDFSAQSEKIVADIAAKLNNKTFEEAFKELNSTSEFNDAILGMVEKSQGTVTVATIKNEILKGNFKAISSMLMELDLNIFKSIQATNDSSGFDAMISYLGKVGKVVKDPVELEKLQNFRLYAIGQKVKLNKQTNPDVANGYNELLKTELRNLLYGKGEAGKLAKSEEIDEYIIDECAKTISDIWMNMFPERTLFGTLESILEKEGYWLKKNSPETLNTLRTKMAEIKERLNIWTEEDFFNDFKSRFSGGAGVKSKLGKKDALDTLNKYLEDGNLENNATFDEIKKAYRKLCLKYHPDRADAANKAAYEEIFKKISDAYSALESIK